MPNYKTSLRYVWLIILVSSLAIYFCFPELFTANFIRQNVQDNEGLVLLIYILFTFIRPVLFIPSTATLLLGLALYPNDLLFLLLINMLGIVFGASLLFAAGNYFTPEQFFSEKKIKSLPKIKDKINKHGFWIVLGWSFFPFVPTDLICFVVGATKMNYWKFIIALFIGELVLVSIYLLTGKGILAFF